MSTQTTQTPFENVAAENAAYEYFEENYDGDVSTLVVATARFPTVAQHDLIGMFFCYQEFCGGAELGEVMAARIRAVKARFAEWTPNTPSKYYRADGSTTLFQDVVARLYNAAAWPPVLAALVDAGCDFRAQWLGKTVGAQKPYGISEFLLMGEGALELEETPAKLRALSLHGAPRPSRAFMHEFLCPCDIEELKDFELFLDP